VISEIEVPEYLTQQDKLEAFDVIASIHPSIDFIPFK
jgi:hypothetical protein